MKLERSKVGDLFRLGAISVALLLGQQALADGTPAGTEIRNTASVDYDVGGVDQDDILSNEVFFVVDRKVSFTLTPLGSDLVDVTPGGNDYFVDFLLTNTSNSTLDFNLLLDQAGVTAARGNADTADMDNAEYAVNDVLYTGSEPFNPVPGGAGNAQYVDQLAADDAIRIRAWGDAATTLVNGAIAGYDLTATAADADNAGAEGTALTLSGSNTDNVVDNVWDTATYGNTNAELTANDGFRVVSASIAVDKDYSIFSDPLNSGFPVPGAVIEYTIDVINSSPDAPAQNVVITDVIDDDVVLLLGAFGGAGLDIQLDNGGSVSTCTADNTDTDDCSVTTVGTTSTLTVGNGSTPIQVNASTTLTITFRVTIPDPTP
ncbi:MAG: hypothetical protein QNJ07_12970 [Woeseiaceae bacterium]|nr:hypothetical protein [Woeseiaceae bacterium]